MARITLTFFVLAILLLWNIIGKSGSWKVKLFFIFAVPLFSFILWTSLGSFRGFPARSSTLPKSTYIYGYYVDPDPLLHIKGAIYIWVIPQEHYINPFNYKPLPAEPKSFKLPYSVNLAQQVQKANNAVKKGLMVGVKGRSSNQGRVGASKFHTKIKLYIIPPTHLPSKG